MTLIKWKGLDVDPRQITESVIVKPNIRPDSMANLVESETAGGLKYLMPRIEAIHAGTTRNNTRYLAEKLRGSAELRSGTYSWLHPYAKPIIYNHDIESRNTGRVHSAFFSELTAAGRPGITVVPKITDKQAIEDILGGLLLTVSIGATTDSATCSLCMTDILEEGFCGHHKGEVYEGTKVEWIAGNLWFDELSWVNVPADQDAMITDAGIISVAEAFAGQGREIIDLGKEKHEWTLTPKMAFAEGLILTKPQEGDSTLTVEELNAKVAELEAEKASLTVQVEEAGKMIQAKEQEILEKSVELDAKTAELAEKAATLEATSTELEEKTQEVAALSTTKEELVTAQAALTTVTEELDTVKAEKTSLVEHNATLVTEAHTSLVERVVDLRLSLGKEAVRETAVEELAKRSTESLKDSLVDLLKESVLAPVTTRVVESVDNPAANSLKVNVEPNSLVEGATAKAVTAEDALMGLFSGPAFAKKN